MRVKKEREKAGLELNINKTKIMVSGQTEGENIEGVTYFIFLAPKSLCTGTAAMKLKDTCSLEGKL